MLVKASAGGGGRGMRIVRTLDALDRRGGGGAGRSGVGVRRRRPCSASRTCEGAHHVEVQVLADAHGTVWAVGERECSIQRRHQKVVEEAPSPLVERIAGMREALFAAAATATRAVGYTGAGTVEFLAADDGTFHFLEMNTRLQVEHPVTECTTGVDLVALQIHVAEGGRLDAAPPPPSGHAIEVRLYAEDPSAGLAARRAARCTRSTCPASPPRSPTRPAPGIRLDSGVGDGTVVGIHYDPLLAKVIAVAPTRDQAARALAGALSGRASTACHQPRPARARAAPPGVPRRRDRHGVLRPPRARRPRRPARRRGAVPARGARRRPRRRRRNRADATVLGSVPGGWRNVPSEPQRKRYDGAGGERRGRLPASTATA